jgi:hypothetical protein
VGALVTNWTSPAPGAQEPVSRSTITSLGGATQAAVTVRFGAGELNIGALSSPGPDELASMDYQGPPQLAPQPRYTASPGGVGQLSYETFGPGSGRPGQGFFPFSNRGGGGQLNLSFAPNVPIASLVLQSGATDAHVDLSNLRVSTLDLSVGAATAWVRFPQAGSTTARISGGASTVTLQIPQGVAAQIQTRGGLSTVNIDQSRFPQVGDGLYRSADYDGAANRLDLTIETGITTIQVS